MRWKGKYLTHGKSCLFIAVSSLVVKTFFSSFFTSSSSSNFFLLFFSFFCLSSVAKVEMWGEWLEMDMTGWESGGRGVFFFFFFFGSLKRGGVTWLGWDGVGGGGFCGGISWTEELEFHRHRGFVLYAADLWNFATFPSAITGIFLTPCLATV